MFYICEKSIETKHLLRIEFCVDFGFSAEFACKLTKQNAISWIAGRARQSDNIIQ